MIDKDLYGDRRFYGRYRGFVIDVKDPDKLGRIRCTVPELFGAEFITDWAWPSPIYGGVQDNGFFYIPEVGSGVWMLFEGGIVDRPVWLGVWWALKEENEVPKLAREVQDETTEPPKGEDEGEGATPIGHEFKEPASPYAAIYPHNKVIKTASGIVIEYDDTEGAERIHFWHPTKTFQEWHPDGSIVYSVRKNVYEVIDGNYELHVKGDMHILVDGNRTVKVGKDENKEVLANRYKKIHKDEFETVLGNREKTIHKDETINVKQNRTTDIDIEEKLTVGADRRKTVMGNEYELIMGIKTSEVLGQDSGGGAVGGEVHRLKIVGDMFLEIIGNRDRDITGHDYCDVSDEYRVSAKRIDFV